MENDAYVDPYEHAICFRHQLPGNMVKYWKYRTSLFSRFHEGILMDKESWFSVTPEAVAYRLAVECATDTILDAFCGAGGNAIQFAFTCDNGTLRLVLI